MTWESIIANAEDLGRIQRLADAGHFAPWFPAFARNHAAAYMWRVWMLALTSRFRKYPGPTVTE